MKAGKEREGTGNERCLQKITGWPETTPASPTTNTNKHITSFWPPPPLPPPPTTTTRAAAAAAAAAATK